MNIVTTGKLEIARPNQIWAMDSTTIPMPQGRCYVTAILDAYSRYVVGWSIGNTINGDWIRQTVEDAITSHGAPEVLTTDRARPFTSKLFTSFLADKGIEVISGGKSSPQRYIERLWSSLKQEYIYLHPAANRDALFEGLKQYFHFYNTERPHQSLGYQTPAEYFSKAS